MSDTLGEVFGGLSVKIKLEEINDITDILGTKEEPGLLLTTIVQCYRDHGKDKPVKVIYFDEIEKIMKEFSKVLIVILNLIDTNTEQSIYLPYLDLTVQLPPVIILISNQKLSNEEAKPLYDRTKEITIAIGDKRKFVLQEVIPRLSKDFRMKPSEEEQAEVDEIIKNDKNPGLRSIQAKLQRYFVKVKRKRAKGKRG